VNRSSKVKTTKQRQSGAGVKQTKSGVPYRGANFVTQRAESSKKGAARSAAARRSAGGNK
jgi:hypothetical protein